jgi:hypothetical protein
VAPDIKTFEESKQARQQESEFLLYPSGLLESSSLGKYSEVQFPMEDQIIN